MNHFGKKISIVSLAVCSLIGLYACGDKKKTVTRPISTAPGKSDDATSQPKNSEWIATTADLPECNSSNDGKMAWVADSKTLMLCHNTEWVSVSTNSEPTGAAPTPLDPGTSIATLNYLVLDGSNKVVGRTDFSGYLKSIEQSAFSFQFADGAVFKINPINGGFSGEQCVYEASDCSSACLFPASGAQKNKIVQGLNGFYRIAGTEVKESKTYSAYTLGDFPAPICAALGGGQSGSLAVMSTAYTFVDGITYPITAPISVRSE